MNSQTRAVTIRLASDELDDGSSIHSHGLSRSHPAIAFVPSPLLSPRTLDVLCFIRRFSLERGMPPTVRDICRGVGIRSTNTGQYHVERLIKAGLLTRKAKYPRSIRLTAAATATITINE